MTYLRNHANPIAACVVAAVLAACTHQRTPNHRAEHYWNVYDGAELILELSDVPGPLISTAAPPPGLRPMVVHPFLSATARSASHEHRLREIVDASKDVVDVLSRLRAAGYDVRPRTR